VQGDKKQQLRLQRVSSPAQASPLQQPHQDAAGFKRGDRAVSDTQPASRQDETHLLEEE